MLFEPFDDGARHGSFADESYAAILANPDWRNRLSKPHTQRHVLPEERRDRARELDSCNSSDALLMNFFCFPGFSARPAVAALLGHSPSTATEFGIAGRVPLANGGSDATEIDMKIGPMIVESKLTESNFTSKPKTVLEKYRDFPDAFDTQLLPQSELAYGGYQLIRNVLCAVGHGYAFALICDARRPDLIREWWTVVRSVRDPEVRARLRLVLWQELAAEAPPSLATFLQCKYGL